MGKVTLDEFIQTWERQIAKIEKQALDGDAVNSISLKFDLDSTQFKMFMSEREAEEEDAYTKLDLLESKLTVALETAHSRFRLENRGALEKEFSGALDKLPKKT
jgi:hypothetical protein